MEEQRQNCCAQRPCCVGPGSLEPWVAPAAADTAANAAPAAERGPAWVMPRSQTGEGSPYHFAVSLRASVPGTQGRSWQLGPCSDRTLSECEGSARRGQVSGDGSQSPRLTLPSLCNTAWSRDAGH